MNSLGYELLWFLFLFNNIIIHFFSLPDIFNYWDEMVFAILFLYGILNRMCSKVSFNSYRDRGLALSFVMVLIGISGNVLYQYCLGFQPIIRDMFAFFKFPLTVLLLYKTRFAYKMGNVCKKKFSKILRFISYCMFLLGVISIFVDIGLSQNEIRHGIQAYQFLFSHPTVLVSASVLIICILETTDKEKNGMAIFSLLVCILLSMRTKGIAFIGAYIFMHISRKWNKQLKVLYWMIMLLILYFVAEEKIKLLASWTQAGRTVLTIGSIKLMMKCFPFGTGFGSFGSHISGKYRSSVYKYIYSPEFFDIHGEPTAILGDTGYPYYIGQFGVVGIITIAMIIYNITKIWSKRQGQEFRCENILMIYIAIALTTEAFLANDGLTVAIVLAVIMTINESKKKNKLEI